MTLRPFVLAFSLAHLPMVCAAVEPSTNHSESETVTIPLDQIWAIDMPGTRDIRELELEQHAVPMQALSPGKQQRTMSQGMWDAVLQSLSSESPTWPREGQVAGPAFVVAGTGSEALLEAYAVLAKGEKVRDSIAFGQDVTIVVFSYQSGAYVELRNVQRREDQITIQYRFIAPQSKIQAARFAIIPFGKLPVGRYRVEFNQLPSGQEVSEGKYGPRETARADEPMEQGWGRRLVSGPFSFAVTRVDREH